MDSIVSLDKFDTYSRRVVYFLDWIRETNKLIPSADDGHGFELARNKIPSIKKMSKEWDRFFYESYELIKIIK